ncbi:ammonium transporter [Pelagicoccus sp. SDUM812005]|uniref:ammonium transporter n=1 Tax=Pelagicoccus sp. SDUM812005 TaxID=3041257 RepID=UPI00280D5082|nr:ammonium transporter [Pelagicoccus sp. SDUM812005]MDQ8182650.1 ammonium transporter [Pelagicoccus sp. SDUM812005]
MGETSLDLLWVVICAALVLLMQAGFLCLESGWTRTKNSINVAVKNLTDFGISVMVYWAFGFALMFGLSRSGAFGGSGFFFESAGATPQVVAFFFFQAMFCGTAVTIVSGAVAERMSFKGYLLISVFVSALVYPIFGHWAWGGALGGQPGWLASLGFIDFAGSSVVHSIGGWVALAGVVALGPRIGRFGEGQDGRSRSIPGQSLPTALLGTLILAFGWIGFNGGSSLAWGGDVPLVVTHTILAATSGMVTALLASLVFLKYPDAKYITNGLLAGLVAITANCHLVSSGSSVLIGAVGALVMMAADRFFERLKLDDVVGAFSVHTAAGIWGTLAVALLGDASAWGEGVSRWDQLGVQALGVVVCALVGFLPAYLFLSGLRMTIRLRVSPEQEVMGLNAAEHKVSTEHLDLLREMELQSQKFDLTRRVTVEPFTEVGQIAQKYNEVLDSLEQTVARNEMVIRDTKDAIFTCSKEGRILSANPGAELMFGYTVEELESKWIWNIIATESEMRFDSLETLLEHIGTKNYKLETIRLSGVRRSGARFPSEMEATAGRIGDSDVFTLKIRDRTQAEVYQEALRTTKREAEKARDELEEKVRQIESFNGIAIDREMRMVELKGEINRLCSELGRKAPFGEEVAARNLET